jgi:hypothetical protein
MIKTQYNLNQSKVVSMVMDTISSRLWIAYELNNGKVILQCVNSLNPTVIYFEIELEVNAIVDMYIDVEESGYLYILYDDTSYLYSIINIYDPSDRTDVLRTETTPIETPVSIVFDTNFYETYILFPGSDSGENAKILVYYYEELNYTVDLNESAKIVTNATNLIVIIDINENYSDMWICTYNSPAELINIHRTWDDYSLFPYTVTSIV